jgi:hypothetical protein
VGRERECERKQAAEGDYARKMLVKHGVRLGKENVWMNTMVWFGGKCISYLLCLIYHLFIVHNPTYGPHPER